MPRSTSRKLFIIITTIGSFILLALMLWSLVDYSEKQIVKTTDAASAMGLNYAKEQCQKSDVTPGTCSTLDTKGASYTECSNGEACWILNVFSVDNSYHASMFLYWGEGDENFIIKDYRRH